MTGITKSFGNFYALKDVNFAVYPGMVNVLIGENGAGKSTLMKIIAGVLSKDAGKMLLNEEEVEIKTPIEAKKLGIGTVYQELMLAPELSIAENIFLGSDLKTGFWGKVRWKDIYEESAKIVKDLLDIDIDTRIKVKKIGIAYQQMIEIARVIKENLKILIMDEPTAALTETEIAKFFETVTKLKNQGIAIIYISHRLEEIFQIGDRVTVLRDGEFVGTVEREKTTRAELVRMMVGREIKDQYPKADFSGIEKQEVLRLENFSGGRFKNINLVVRKGEILGLAGLMGAGRTEIARAIFGADKHSGTIFIDGKAVSINNITDAIAAGIALVPEDRKRDGLILNQPIVNNVTIANLKRISSKFLGVLSKGQEINDVEDCIKVLRISVPNKLKEVRTLSGGNQQKVVVSKWIYANSRILILDEPTRGIDVGAKTEIYHLINRFVQDGKVVLVISSELPELLGICTRIAVVKSGEITREFGESEMDQEAILNAMIGGGTSFE